MMKRILHFFIVPLFSIAALGLIIWNHFPQFIPGRKIPLCDHCNIVIIDIDLLRSDALSCLGNSRKTTPNICEFAKNSVLFEKNIAQSSWTLPDLFSLLTSSYPFTHDMLDRFQHPLSQEILTAPEILKKSGYQTMWVGETGNYTISQKNGGQRGFDRIISSPNRGISDWNGIAEQFLSRWSPSFIYFYEGSSLHTPYLLSQDESPIEVREKPEDFPATDEEFAQMFGDFLKEYEQEIFTDRAKEENPEIFRNVSMTDSRKFSAYYSALLVDHPDQDAAHTYVKADMWSVTSSFVQQYVSSQNSGKQQQRVEYFRMLYDTKVSSVDRKLASLLKLLEKPEFSQNTIVVILSNHGEEFLEHGRISHIKHLYNELLHTPLILKISGLPSRRISELTRNIDILPTILEAAGLPYSGKMQGNSLVPLLEDRMRRRREVYAISATSLENISIQNDSWKLIADLSISPKPQELYDLKADPAEQNNLLIKERRKTDELLKILVDLVAKSTNRN